MNVKVILQNELIGFLCFKGRAWKWDVLTECTEIKLKKDVKRLLSSFFIQSYAKKSETALLSLTCYFLCSKAHRRKAADRYRVYCKRLNVCECIFITRNNAGLKSKTKMQFINYQAFSVWSRKEIHFCIIVYSVTYSLHVMQILLYPVRWHKGQVVLISMHHLLIVRAV